MKLLHTLLLLFAVTTLSAQVEVNNGGGWFGSGDRVRGNGEVVTRSRDIDGFTGIKTCCSFKVEVAEGNFDVRVEAESNLQEFIETEVQGRTLHIKYTEDANFKSTEPITVYVSLPRLESIAASSSSKVTGTTPFTGEDLELDVSSSANIEVAFSGDRVDLDASSSGRIDVRGSAKRVTADASSASRIEAGNLQAEEAVADVSSAANISVHASKRLRADASSAGSVRYSGSPSDIVTDTSSAGRVSSRNR
ncbi:putative autotransporter adhesin-like protein [Neolewinella xylanilytica]|uniref:Putative autotransporter adhesin-like protein n=1 Tax=Neolewinella xylanilytica TaxID=1514080 RepID=A0A2S6IBG2_9BACT|nr:head GIN domain-containing protein [Neolewinella xylanilytica]PPK88825.1 putative autotransporter adhesin-like protein [Neolewinella xylanilytica]